MERKHTAVYFLTAIALIAFAVVIFGISNGTVLTAYDDGDFNYSTLLTPLLAYGACLLGFLGIITLLCETIEPSLWFSVGCLFVVAALISYLLGLTMLLGILFSLAFGGWFLLAGIRSLVASWYDYEPWLNLTVAVCRVAAGAALLSYILLWSAIPTTPTSKYDLQSFAEIMADPGLHSVCTLSAVLSIVAAVAIAVEAVLWIKTLDD